MTTLWSSLSIVSCGKSPVTIIRSLIPTITIMCRPGTIIHSGHITHSEAIIECTDSSPIP